jgi:hypothetical protein
MKNFKIINKACFNNKFKIYENLKFKYRKNYVNNRAIAAGFVIHSKNGCSIEINPKYKKDLFQIMFLMLHEMLHMEQLLSRQELKHNLKFKKRLKRLSKKLEPVYIKQLEKQLGERATELLIKKYFKKTNL